MTIIVHQRPLKATRTANKSCKWMAEAIVNGRCYTATSRMAPANDIARQLVADGVPDAPMQVYTARLKGCLAWRSFYRAAGFTCEEAATKPAHMVRWESAKARAARITATLAPKQGVKAPAGVQTEFRRAPHYRICHVEYPISAPPLSIGFCGYFMRPIRFRGQGDKKGTLINELAPNAEIRVRDELRMGNATARTGHGSGTPGCQTLNRLGYMTRCSTAGSRKALIATGSMLCLSANTR